MKDRPFLPALERIYRAALAAVDARTAVERSLILRQGKLTAGQAEIALDAIDRIFLLAVGKAAAPMAAAAEGILGPHLHAGLAVTKHEHAQPLRVCRILEAGHPQPDQAGLDAASTTIEFLSVNLRPRDLLLVLVSGGGSALLPAPAAGIPFEDKRKTTELLLSCGADIHEMNAIRKHLSRLKGGRLLDHVNGCQVAALLVSDVIGDDPSVIASGLTAPDPTTFSQCMQILASRRLLDRTPRSVLGYLRSGADRSGGVGDARETPKPGDPRFQRVSNSIVASNRMALEAAAQQARREGLSPLILSSSIDGDVGEAARYHLEEAAKACAPDLLYPVKPPFCLISGGEATVVVQGDGMGGRNTEFVLCCALGSRQWKPKNVLFASLGSDGEDGPTPAAGAWATPETVRAGEAKGMDGDDYLQRNDSYRYFRQLDQLVVTGPTRTNVMDIRLILSLGESE